MKDNGIESVAKLWRVKVVCRWAIGLVWIWEGLVPKILWPTDLQRELVEHSGWYWPSVDGFLVLLGSGMIVAGVSICAGVLERAAVCTATITMGILIVLVVGNNPSSLSDLHGGIAKDLGLAACALVVWELAGIRRMRA